MTFPLPSCHGHEVSAADSPRCAECPHTKSCYAAWEASQPRRFVGREGLSPVTATPATYSPDPQVRQVLSWRCTLPNGENVLMADHVFRYYYQEAA